MSAESIAEKWRARLLSTEPVDRARAEAALRAAYRHAGLDEPAAFLLCASPLEAAWAALVLIGEAEGYNIPLLKDARRMKGGEGKLAAVRDFVAGRLGIDPADVEGHFGLPFYRSSGSSPMAQRLMQERWWTYAAPARSAWDWQVGRPGPFEKLDRLEDLLHREGHEAGLVWQGLARAGAKPVAVLGKRSAQHRLYGNLAFGEIARDEALVEQGAGEATDLQRALWEVYESCGLWWPLESGVVLADRPCAREGTDAEPGLAWADGFTIGSAAPRSASATSETIEAPATAAAPVADLLGIRLPATHDERIAFLRAQAPRLPLFDRYLAGEHRQVWADLVALGEQALAPDCAADTLAVAYETMHRVEINVRLIAERLQALGYRFVWPGIGRGLFGLGKGPAHAPHVPPGSDVHEAFAKLEEAAGGRLPLSLRVFYEVVGEVNFNGEHARLAPADGPVTPDPLVVEGIEGAMDWLDGRDEDEPPQVAIAPDALHKANISGGAPYSVAVPAPVADAPLEDEPHDVTFVEYLRIAIAWGGFPGWETAGREPPGELEELRQGLTAF
jgi:hypothetical protein